jgi:hypothetical protein
MNLLVAQFISDLYIRCYEFNTTMWYKICCHILQTMSIINTILYHFIYCANHFSKLQPDVLIRHKEQ